MTMKTHPDALRVPRIHLNGTSKEALVREYAAAREAVVNAMDAIKAITVHGRDYYVQSGNAYNEAAAQHRDRLLRLDSVREELEAILRKLQWEG